MISVKQILLETYGTPAPRYNTRVTILHNKPLSRDTTHQQTHPNQRPSVT